MKECKMCRKRLPFSCFYRDRQKKDGLKVYCKICDYSFVRRSSKKVFNERVRKRRDFNRSQMNETYWNRVAIRHKLPKCKLISIYEEQNKKCFYCKIGVDGMNLHIDHYYPKKNDKIVIACQDCNRLKWQRPGDEFIKFLEEYKSRFS